MNENVSGEIGIEKVSLLPQRHEAVHIAFAVDAKYMRHMGVAMTSLLVHNPAINFHFHIVYDSMHDQDLGKITQLAQMYQVPVYFYKVVSAPMIESLRTVYHISKVVYYRLLLPYVLPQHLTKVLFLDADLVCIGDIRKIWHIPLEERALAAKAMPATNDQIVTLTLKNGCYLQAGVMLLNLPVWRQQELTKRVIEYLITYPDKTAWLEQDALAALLDGNFAKLAGDVHTVIDCARGSGKITEGSVIIHFAGMCKPWQEWCPDDRKDLYWQYLKMSPWFEARPEQATTPYHSLLAARLEIGQGNVGTVQRILDRLLEEMVEK